MTTLVALTDRLRLELGDPAQGFQAKVATDGSTTRFSLPVELVDSSNIKVVLQSNPGSPLVLGTDFDMDFDNGVLTTAAPLPSGDMLIVQGSYAETFLREDLEVFVETAFLQHTHGRTNEYGLPLRLQDLPPVEEYLVVLLAEIEALWVLITDAAQEIDVRNPDGVNIPVGQRYQQLLGLLAAKRAQYEELASALNVGLFRVEMFTLRRTSRTTNRLVPIYKAMEYDERPKGFWPDYGPAGTIVTVKGDHFTGVTGVSVGGVAVPEFQVVNDEHLQLTIPEGAITGHIVITTPGGVATSQYIFTVGPKVPMITYGAGQQRLRPPIDDGLV